MQIRLSYRNAFFLALTISTLTFTSFLFIYLYYQHAILPREIEIATQLISTQTVAIHIANSYLASLVLSFFLYALNFRLLSLQMRPKKRLALIMVSTFIATFILSTSFSGRQLIMYNADYFKHVVLSNYVRDHSIALIVFFTSQLLYLYNKQQRTAFENRELIAENIRTRYEALKNQVDPHFLFNSLNTLNSLIEEDALKAKQYVQQLSHVFRYTLQNRDIISLEDELNYTKAYCHLMQIRYGDGLRFEYQINPRFNDYSIIPLSLQTLVENAIKHNVVSEKYPLTISLATGDKGTICVSNPIQPKKEMEKGEGVGLVNLAERYRLMWKQEIVVTQNDGVFRIEIQLKNNH